MHENVGVKRVLRGILPNAIWDGIKTILRWGWPVFAPLIYALIEKARHIDQDWLGIFALFAFGVVFSTLGILWDRRERREFDKKLDERLLEVQREIPSIMVNGVLVAGPAKVVADKAQCAALSLFTPLQVEAFQLAMSLRGFLRELGPRPDANWGRPESDPDWIAKKLTERHNIQEPWIAGLTHRYAREFAPRVKNLMHRFGEIGLPVQSLEPYTECVGTEHNILCIAHTLDGLAVELSYREISLDDLDEDTTSKYQKMGLKEQRRLLDNFPTANKALDIAYARKVKWGLSKDKT